MGAKSYSDLEKAVSELQSVVAQQKLYIDAVMKDQGIESAITGGFDRLEAALAINALGPRRTLNEKQMQAITALRSNLGGVAFHTLEVDREPRPFTTDQTRAAE